MNISVQILDKNLTNPMQHPSSLTGVGVGKSRVALIFSGRGEMLATSMLCPRKLVLEEPKVRLSKSIRRRK